MIFCDLSFNDIHVFTYYDMICTDVITSSEMSFCVQLYANVIHIHIMIIISEYDHPLVVYFKCHTLFRWLYLLWEYVISLNFPWSAGVVCMTIIFNMSPDKNTRTYSANCVYLGYTIIKHSCKLMAFVQLCLLLNEI